MGCVRIDSIVDEALKPDKYSACAIGRRAGR
jgi:hypothetical protein